MCGDCDKSGQRGRVGSVTHKYTAALVACGDLGARLAARLPAPEWRTVGLRRNPASLPATIEPIPADLTQPQTLAVLGELKPDLLLLTPTPLSRTAEGYRAGYAQATRHVVDALNGHSPRWAMLVSSTRVYGDSDGALVEEDGRLETGDPCALAIQEAERVFLEGIAGSLVLRSAGLYGGDGPGYLLRRVASGELTPALPLRFGNRIHRDDLVGCMDWLLTRGIGERVLNLVDDAPVAQQEVERWLCEQLGISYRPPPGSAQAVSRKRISNRRLREAGYVLRYPDYRAGYAEVLKRWKAHSEGEDRLDLH